MVNSIASEVYAGRVTKDKTSSELALLIGKQLFNEVKKTLKTSISEAESEHRQRWLNRIHNNIYSFSTAKSYDEMKQFRDAVFDDNGKPVSSEEFKQRVQAISELQNHAYLETERQAVVRGTVMGDKWIDIEEQADVAPYLEYVTAGDSHVREEHAELAGIIEPVDSPFWEQYYPPNGWNCRCSVRQLTEREAIHKGYKPKTNDNMKLAGKEVDDKYWRHNAGKGVVFDEDRTAYFESAPGKGKKQLKAVDNYGMKTPEEIYADPSKMPNINQVDFDEFVKNYSENGIMKIEDPQGFNLSFDESFFDHLKKSKHTEEIGELLNVASQPDEVWEHFKSGLKYKGEFFRTYIKYYEETPIVLLVDEANRARTFYKLKNKKDVADFRTGVLTDKK
ncbi:hypothetical protein LJC16_02180 [Bacteroidales bacterium OttesenSCG-928-C19]|nr:hypothetical protein [Bacteroidales bacterium OttesenSCG-928-C19]